jgi:chromate transporter
MNAAVLAALAWRFGGMAFLAIGGANAVVPEMHRQVVEAERWMTASEFAALFAIANAAPGPNVLVVTLVGWHVAGVAGALVATLAFVAPTALLTYGVFHLWARYAHAPWRPPVQDGLAAVTVGLLAATSFLLLRATGTSAALVAITLATAWIVARSKLNPLWLLAVGAAIGGAGWV